MLQRLPINLGWNTELRCLWWSNSFKLLLFCEALNCVVSGGTMSFNYTGCAKHRIALWLVEQRLPITLGLPNTELRCHWWSIGFQTLGVRNTDLRCPWWSIGFQLHLVCEKQNCVVTGGASAFNYTWCAKHRIALSLVEQRLPIILGVRSTELRFHWCCNSI